MILMKIALSGHFAQKTIVYPYFKNVSQRPNSIHKILVLYIKLSNTGI